MINIRKLTIIIATYFILYANLSFYCTNMISERINMCIYIISIFMIMLVSSANEVVIVDKKTLLSLMGLIMLPLASSLIAGDQAKLIVYPILVWILTFVYVRCVDFVEFRDALINIMVFTSVVAIFMFVMYKCFPQLYSVLPMITNEKGTSTFFLGFGVLTPRSPLRLEGFFWEPGAFQIFLNLAILLMVGKTYLLKSDIKKMIVLYIALILTFSTTGIIVGVLNLFILIVRNMGSNLNGRVKVACLIFMAVALLLVIIPMLPESIGGISTGKSKVMHFLQGTSKDTYDSASVRFDSIYYPIILFFQKPFIGGGYQGLKNLSDIMHHDMCTCTPVNFFAMYGVLYGGLIMYGFYKMTSHISNDGFVRILVFGSIMLSIFTENLNNYISLNMIIGYGLFYYDKFHLIGVNSDALIGD